MPQPKLFPLLKSGPTVPSLLVNSSPMSLVISARLIVRMKQIVDSMTVLSNQLNANSFVNRIRVVTTATHNTLDDLGLTL
jgi:hypothetical protein